MRFEVKYMSGAGNTFTVIDNRKYKFPADYYSIVAPALCGKNELKQTHTEGLLVINESFESDFNVFFFNPDGSDGMMCGNGGRCAVAFAAQKGFIPKIKLSDKIFFNMAGGDYIGELVNHHIRLFLPPPIEIKENIKIQVKDNSYRGVYVNVNSDHYVINYDKLDTNNKKSFEDFCIDTCASPIRFHKDFEPNGVNVNFYYIESRQKLFLRTYERGVEAETGACGTGALSTMITALLNDEIDLPVTIIPPSKIPLIVDIEGEFPSNIKSLILEGSAEIKKSAFIDISEINEKD